MSRPRRPGLLHRVRRAALLGALALLLLAVTLVLALRWINPPTSAFMLEARAHAWLRGERHYRTDYRWAPLPAISPQAALAVIASEDQGFPFNDGFDFRSIREAIAAHEHGARLRGASTITQQVAKNLFLWGGRSFVRKGIEAGFTVLLNALWPKRRILEVYLNVAQFAPGLYGAQAAALRFFHEPAARLTAADSALLAAVLPDPARLHVAAPSRYLIGRRDWILGQMARLGGLSYLSRIDPPARRAEPLSARQ